jgi:sulfane dehydrogenase subunit SoxC
MTRRPRLIGRRTLLRSASGLVASIAAGRHALAAPPVARAPGRGMTPLSERAPTEHPERGLHEQLVGISSTPLGELDGTITPSDLHFTRHHAGIPAIDPVQFELLVHGLVQRATVFKLDELRRLPSRTVTCFVECAGNGLPAVRSAGRERTPGDIDGSTSNSEWTGVALRTVLQEVGVEPAARWLLAQSEDAGRYARSIPIEKAMDDALLAYAQNGEPIRAEQGYPLRLLLPGWEGSTSVKWLRRIELGERPWLMRDETARFSGILRDGRVRMFDFELGPKSIITAPAYPRRIDAGWWEIRGLAWSGAGRIARVEVSVDGGAAWHAAALDEPVLPKAHTRFRFPWRWHGAAAVLLSRAVDERGQVQPSWKEFSAARASGNDYHNNHVRGWRVEPDGRVFFERG